MERNDLRVSNNGSCRIYFYFGGPRSKGFAAFRNVSKLPFFDKIGHAKSGGFRFYSAIWRSKSRISSRYLEITSISLIYSLIFRGRKNYNFGFPRVWTDSPVWPVRSGETLSWGISRLRYCDPRWFRMWKIVMKLCTSFGTRLGVQVRDFSACFGYFTKWDRTTSWYLEITSSLVFNLLEE